MAKQLSKNAKGALIGIAVFLLVAAIVLACCLTLIKTSECVIEIGAHIDDWDEAEFAAQLAEDKPDGIYLAKDGLSDFKILLKDEYRDRLELDAVYMQRTLRKMLGADPDASEQFEIISQAADCPMIVLNELPASDKQAEDALLADVLDDGYRLMYASGNIYICGQKRSTVYEAPDNKVVPNDGTAGTQNGIYCFLENDLGCMFVREEAKYDYVPRLNTVCLAGEGRVDNPDFAWRRVYQYEVNDFATKDTPVEPKYWSRRIKSNGTGEYLFTPEGSGMNDGNAQWGTWCHSVFTFVPPEMYFETHPEYYALMGGKRRTEYKGAPGQLCLSNPEIIGIIEQGMRRLMDQYPDAIYWDFSINDSKQHCTCSKCNAKYRKYGSQAGVMCEVINELARRMPDKRICTLAYFYTKKVPKGITLEDNVSVTIAPLCSSQLYSSKYGFMNSSQAKSMVEQWSKVAKHITLWDYTINFRHLLSPFPNYAVQGENLQFYKENGVDMVFHQGSREKDDEQARLRSYVLARQLWDIDTDINVVMGKYLQVTYGSAAEDVAQYLDLMHSEVQKAVTLDIYDDVELHGADYLSKSNLKKYRQILDRAYNKADNDDVGYFVEELQINVDYATMMAFATTIKEKNAAFERFKTLVYKHGIERVNEVGEDYNMDNFINYTYPKLQKSIEAKFISICIFVPIGAILLTVAIIFAVKGAKAACARRRRSVE